MIASNSIHQSRDGRQRPNIRTLARAAYIHMIHSLIDPDRSLGIHALLHPNPYPIDPDSHARQSAIVYLRDTSSAHLPSTSIPCLQADPHVFVWTGGAGKLDVDAFRIQVPRCTRKPNDHDRCIYCAKP